MARNHRGSPIASTADVLLVQEALQHAKLYDGPIDGIPGARTMVALRAYKRREGLRGDGSFGGMITTRVTIRQNCSTFGAGLLPTFIVECLEHSTCASPCPSVSKTRTASSPVCSVAIHLKPPALKGCLYATAVRIMCSWVKSTSTARVAAIAPCRTHRTALRRAHRRVPRIGTLNRTATSIHRLFKDAFPSRHQTGRSAPDRSRQEPCHLTSGRFAHRRGTEILHPAA